MPPSSPVGLKSPPKHAPKKLRTDADLLALQRMMTRALVTPLTDADDLAPRWHDGRPMAEVVEEFIKPNARLTASERLRIYSISYWYRLIEAVGDDAPGLRGLLGEQKFDRLVRAYLAKYPSQSFTLRNLSSRLAQFIRETPRLTAPDTGLADAIARFEWAQTEAFDGEAKPVLTPEDLAGTPPARLRLGLQPYLSLLAFDWPVDDYVLAIKQRDALRSEASNAIGRGTRTVSRKVVRRPRRRKTYVVVHRYNLKLYYKRLEAPAFKMLTAIAAGQTLAQAVAAAGRGVKPEQVREWFATWMELGWFCKKRRN
jgi:hypothetical protein